MQKQITSKNTKAKPTARLQAVTDPLVAAFKAAENSAVLGRVEITVELHKGLDLWSVQTRNPSGDVRCIYAGTLCAILQVVSDDLERLQSTA